MTYPFEYFLNPMLKRGVTDLLEWDWTRWGILPSINWDELRLVRLARMTLEQHPLPFADLQHQIVWKLIILEDLSRAYSAWAACRAAPAHNRCILLDPFCGDALDDDRHAFIRGNLCEGLVKYDDIRLIAAYMDSLKATSPLSVAA
jgi:hypothetical protein